MENKQIHLGFRKTILFRYEFKHLTPWLSNLSDGQNLSGSLCDKVESDVKGESAAQWLSGAPGQSVSKLASQTPALRMANLQTKW